MIQEDFLQPGNTCKTTDGAFVLWITPLLKTLSTKQTSNANKFTFCRLPGFNCVLSIILIAT
jgi:hypothetical protein